MYRNNIFIYKKNYSELPNLNKSLSAVVYAVTRAVFKVN